MVSQQEDWNDLLAGNARFATGVSRQATFTPELRKKLSESQHPHTVVVACADSRVPPELVFDVSLGEFFTVRTAGPTLDDMVLASIEFGVIKLGARRIIVMTHTNCGAVETALSAMENRAELTVGEPGSGDAAAALENLFADTVLAAGGMIVTGEQMDGAVGGDRQGSSYLPGIVARMRPVIQRAQAEGVTDPAEFSRRNAVAVVQRLRAMPAITELWQSGELEIHAVLYHLDTGRSEEIPV